MKIVPAKNIVVIEPEVSEGLCGEFVVVQEKGQEVGRVVAVGEPMGDKFLPIDGLKRGDLIAYRRYGESKFFLEGREYLFVSFDDVLGLIRRGGKKNA